MRIGRRLLPRLLLAACFWLPLVVPDPLWAQQETSAPEAGSAEAVVWELYDLVTFPAGAPPDWERGRALFLPEGVVVLRSSRTATTVFSVEGWVQDFISFIERANVSATGFVERIVRTHSVEFGDIAHVWVLYEAEIPGAGRPPQQGVDSFQLVRRDGTWLIASILNEIPTPDRPVPEVLREGG
ncbi:MAG: hypothetical protein ACWGSQ_17100 [Longimicrobiales bacterium]